MGKMKKFTVVAVLSLFIFGLNTMSLHKLVIAGKKGTTSASGYNKNDGSSDDKHRKRCVRLQKKTPGKQQNGNININGTVIAAKFIGDGSQLTGINAGSGGDNDWIVFGSDMYSNVTGNVGVGTTNPQAKLHIGGNSGVDGLMFPDGTLQTTAAISGGSSPWAINSSDINNTNTGKVGIGTATPEWKLHVVGSHPFLIDNTGSPFNDSILFRRFGVNQYTLGVTSEPSLDIFDQVAQAFRFTIRSSGNVGISDQAPSERLSVGGNITATGTITQGSSRELKKDITMISTKEAIETLNTLFPIKFKYKAEDSGEEHLGFIAEDVPDLVAFKDRKQLSSMDMTAVFVRVVQEQQRVIKKQQEMMDTMTHEMQKIKLTVNSL